MPTILEARLPLKSWNLDLIVDQSVYSNVNDNVYMYACIVLGVWFDICMQACVYLLLYIIS